MTTYIVYVDDSGDEKTAVYTAILMPVEKWSENLTKWLVFRKNLFNTYDIPASFELHATELIGGKTQPSPSFKFGKSDLVKRQRVLELAVATVGTLDSVRIISKVVPHVTPEVCYSMLLSEIERVLAAEDSWAMLVVDGNGTEASHKVAHRALKLSTRRIIEDPWHQESHLSQFVQMADIVSYTIFQAHSLRPSRRFMWGWMKRHLHTREWSGCCVCVP